MPTVAVFGSSRPTPGDAAYRDGLRLGELLAAEGLVVANGGYAGIMEAVSAGAAARGGKVIGITAPSVFPDRVGANPFLSEEIPAKTISERIHLLVDLADATITLPGSIGTLTEFVVAWNASLVAPLSGRRPKPHVAVGAQWRRAAEYLAAAFDADAGMVTYVDDVEAAVAAVAAHLESPGRLRR